MSKKLTIQQYAEREGLSYTVVYAMTKREQCPLELWKSGKKTYIVVNDEEKEVKELEEKINSLTLLITRLCKHLGVSTDEMKELVN